VAQDEQALVIIPTYNEKENIRAIVELVLSQVANLEVLVVDDNSPDGTAAIVKEMAQTEPRVHLLSRGREAGAGYGLHRRVQMGLGARARLPDRDGRGFFPRSAGDPEHVEGDPGSRPSARLALH